MHIEFARDMSYHTGQFLLVNFEGISDVRYLTWHTFFASDKIGACSSNSCYGAPSNESFV